MGAGKYNGEIFGYHTPTSVQTGGGEIILNHREKTSRGSLTPPHPIASVTAAPQYERREKTRWNKGSICKPRLSLPGGTPAYDLYSFPSGQGKKMGAGNVGRRFRLIFLESRQLGFVKNLCAFILRIWLGVAVVAIRGTS
jgi:hypothetical protein